MIVMFNNINRGDKPDSTDSITVVQFERLIENLKEQGFEAINTEQLADFLESNKKIPLRSVLLLQDGRRTAGNFEQNFRQYWEDWGWPVVNGWIIQTDTPESLWQENLALEQEGFVDHQLYSSLHRFSKNASEEFLSGELKKYTDIFEERYNKAPIAITWPGEPGSISRTQPATWDSAWDSPKTRADRSCTTGSHWQNTKTYNDQPTTPKTPSTTRS